jgi:hypothetical protein
VDETVVKTYSIQYLIHQITIITTNSHLSFGDAALTCFGFYRDVIYREIHENECRQVRVCGVNAQCFQIKYCSSAQNVANYRYFTFLDNCIFNC